MCATWPSISSSLVSFSLQYLISALLLLIM
jgi:hypothetical protein